VQHYTWQVAYVTLLLAQKITDLKQTISLDTYVKFNLLGQEVSCVAMNLGEACHLTCIGTAQIRILRDLHK